MRWLFPVVFADCFSVDCPTDLAQEKARGCQKVPLKTPFSAWVHPCDAAWCRNSPSNRVDPDWCKASQSPLVTAFAQHCEDFMPGLGQMAYFLLRQAAANFNETWRFRQALDVEKVGLVEVRAQSPLPKSLYGTPSTSSSDEVVCCLKTTEDEIVQFADNGKFEREFEVLGELGKGGFGRVLKARHRLDDQLYAIKVVQLRVNPAKPIKYNDMFREVRAAAKLNSKYLVRYHSCWLESKSSTEDREESDSEDSSGDSVSDWEGLVFYLYMQLEYCPGLTLDKWTATKPDPSSIGEVFVQLLKGCKAIHEAGFIHRDLKPANIFVDANHQVKIGDFGLAVGADQGRYSPGVGTPLYTAPEQSTSKYYSQRVDVYSLGLVLAELCGQFDTQHEKLNAFRAIKAKREVPQVLKGAFEGAKELILRLTAPTADERPSIYQVLTDRCLAAFSHI